MLGKLEMRLAESGDCGGGDKGDGEAGGLAAARRHLAEAAETLRRTHGGDDPFVLEVRPGPAPRKCVSYTYLACAGSARYKVGSLILYVAHLILYAAYARYEVYVELPSKCGGAPWPVTED
jgi:hypothetical protein